MYYMYISTPKICDDCRRCLHSPLPNMYTYIYIYIYIYTYTHIYTYQTFAITVAGASTPPY